MGVTAEKGKVSPKICPPPRTQQPWGHTETAHTKRGFFVSRARLLDTEHETTLFSVNNLAFSLSQCGHKTEAGQLIRNT